MNNFVNLLKKKNIPNEISKELKKINNSGTIIIWSKCDRLDVARGDTLFRHMQGDLCRIFRHRLNNDNDYGEKVNINYKIIGKKFNEAINANDPLYLMTPNTCPGHTKVATNEKVYDENIPINYKNDKGETKTTNVRIIFTVAKPSIQDLGGASPLGKHYAKNTGISVVRNAREISFKTFGFFDRFEQRNRWWGCEVRYDDDGDLIKREAVDGIFGLTNNKQEVTKFYYEDSSIAEDMYGEEEYEDRKKRDLSLQMRISISKAFKDVFSPNYKIISTRGTGKRGGGKTGNSSVDIVNKVLGKDNAQTRSFIEGKKKSLEQKKSEWEQLIKKADPEISREDLDEEIESSLKRKVSIQFGEWPGEQFFTVQLAGNTAVGLINRLHPYYKDFYDKLIQKGDGNDIKTVDMLLMSFVRMEDEMYSMREDIEKVRNRWGRYLQDFLEELKKTS